MEQRQRIIIGILTLGTLMGSLDSTIVVLAFPTISKDLHADLLTTLWIILIYLLVVAVSTTQLGRLGDIYGRSRMFNAGFGVFTIGSLFCGLSPGIGWLIGSRAVQALGGALMQANSGAIVADTFPPQMRGAAFGYISLGWTVGAMLGIVLGGIITTFIGWQYIFFINIPIGIVATILGIRYVTDAIRVPSRLDIMGIVLLGCSLTLISYGAVDFAGSGFGTSSIIPAILGIIFLGLFLMYERRISFPILDISKLKSRVLKFSILATFFASLGYISVAFLVIMYLQGIRGLSPLDASLLLIPGYIVGSFLAPLMGRYSDRYGARHISTLGCVALVLACFVYYTLRTGTSLGVVLIGSGISGVGTAMFYPANNSAVMANAPPDSYGAISGILRTMQNIGVLGSFVIAITVASASIPRQVASEVFIGTTNLLGGVSESFIRGIDAALVVSIIMITIAGILSWMRGKGIRAHAQEDP
jgi:EmrB/QacA subfamily drug resistance transporter